MKPKILKECTEIALANNNPSHDQWDCYKHYSFIVQENKIVSWGTNKRGSPLTFLGYQPHQKIHVETVAYFKADRLLKKNIPFEVVNIRLGKNNMIKISAPCKCCSNFLKNLGCKRIWFTTTNGSFACMGNW